MFLPHPPCVPGRLTWEDASKEGLPLASGCCKWRHQQETKGRRVTSRYLPPGSFPWHCSRLPGRPSEKGQVLLRQPSPPRSSCLWVLTAALHSLDWSVKGTHCSLSGVLHHPCSTALATGNSPFVMLPQLTLFEWAFVSC